MTTLVLVRHGQASFGARNYDALSPLGQRQGDALGRYWRDTGFTADAWYSGAMARQRDTGIAVRAALGHPDTTVRTHAAFDEYDHQGLIRAYLPLIAADDPSVTLDRREMFADPRAFQRFFEKIIACWLQGRPCGEPIRETWDAFCERCSQGLRDVAREGPERVVAFTSGGFIAVALKEALRLDGAAAFEANWRVYNASVHLFRLGPRGLALVGFNHVAHLELARDPALLTFR
jgi:broad specificity phosphatase PhoE